MDIIDGTYVSINRRQLYIKPAGRGIPPVVIEPGWGSLSAEWTFLQNDLSKYTSVITYDRAGYGESAEAKQPRTSDQITEELNTLLENAQVPMPIILLGHSAGGFYVQHFARKYPDKVGGVVLVDSISDKDKEFDKLDAPNYQKYVSVPARMENIRKYLDYDKDQFEQMAAPFLEKLYPNYPEPIKKQLVAYQTDLTLYKTIIDEYEAFDESMEQLRNAPEFPSVPLKVLSRDPQTMKKLTMELNVPEEEAQKVEELWQKHIKELAELSPKNEFIIAEGTSHNIHLEKPELIVEAVRSIIDTHGGIFEIG